MKNNRSGSKKEYLISLYQSRSKIAFACGILVLSFSLLAIFYGVIQNGNIFQYFTVLSNLFSAIGAAFMIPYAVEGIRQKRFVLPRWVVMFQFCGALGVAITFITTLLIILPFEGVSAVRGMNFWLHLITPNLTIILFQCVETGVSFTRREMHICLIPYWGYMLLYFIMVVVIGEEKGGWPDIYHTMELWPAWVSAILMFLLGYGVALLLRKIQNIRAKQSVARLSKLWAEEMDPVELRIEAFGLGRYMGSHCEPDDIHIPLDIFEMMADKYDISVYDLSKSYVKGVTDSVQGFGSYTESNKPAS